MDEARGADEGAGKAEREKSAAVDAAKARDLVGDLRRKRPELLLPAGSLEVLKTAVRFGADAVYIGGGAFSLRAKARNFTAAEMAEGIAFAHAHGARVHVAANIFAHNGDLAAAAAYFQELKELRPDALLISDPGMFLLARKICPEIDVHISTQANNTNYGTYQFWHGLGAKRVVAARELSLAELREIRARIPAEMETECFVHGAMCMSYSGRCLLSRYLTGRDANRGACTHPCRWSYAVMEKTRPGVYLPVEEDARGSYIFSAGDLCMIEHVPELLDAGIDSWKIEGRMKTALYVATAARAYRKAIDDCLKSEEAYRSKLAWYRDELNGCTHREYTTGFYFGAPEAGRATDGARMDSREDERSGPDGETRESADENAAYTGAFVYLGTVGKSDGAGRVQIEQRNKFCVGDEIEIMKPDGRNVKANVRGIVRADGSRAQSAPHAKERLWLELDAEAKEGELLRLRTENGSGTARVRQDGRCGAG